MAKYRNYLYLFFIPGLLLILLPRSSTAQNKIPIDNGYYITYPDKLLVRVYLSQKYAPLTISGSSDDKDLNYKTSSKLALGIGATYSNVTLNLSYGFTFLNKDKGQGNTRGIRFAVPPVPT